MHCGPHRPKAHAGARCCPAVGDAPAEVSEADAAANPGDAAAAAEAAAAYFESKASAAAVAVTNAETALAADEAALSAVKEVCGVGGTGGPAVRRRGVVRAACCCVAAFCRLAEQAVAAAASAGAESGGWTRRRALGHCRTPLAHPDDRLRAGRRLARAAHAPIGAACDAARAARRVPSARPPGGRSRDVAGGERAAWAQAPGGSGGV